MAYENEAVTIAEVAYSVALSTAWVSLFNQQFKIRDRLQGYLDRKTEKLRKV